MNALHLSETAIIDQARRAGPQGGIARIAWRQAKRELILRFRSIRVRGSDNRACLHAYEQVSPDELAELNLRQAWANWRTIPRNLRGLPDCPVQAVDLCSGLGDSTAVLAWWLPAGSRIHAFEANARYAATAARRIYVGRRGGIVPVTVHCQSVLDPLSDEQGCRLADGSIDLAASCGAVGCHFGAGEAATVLDEVSRIVRPGGMALIDTGPNGVGPEVLMDLAGARGLKCEGDAKSCAVDRNRQLRLRRC